MAIGMGYGGATRNVHKIDWTLVAVDVLGGVFGGIIGYMLSVIGLIAGIVLLIAMPYMKLEGNMKNFVLAFSISMIAGGIASLIAGGAQAIDSETLSQSDNAFAKITAIPMKINEKVFETLHVQRLQLSPEMIPEDVAQSIISQYAVTGQSAGGGATWGY